MIWPSVLGFWPGKINFLAFNSFGLENLIFGLEKLIFLALIFWAVTFRILAVRIRFSTFGFYFFDIIKLDTLEFWLG